MLLCRAAATAAAGVAVVLCIGQPGSTAKPRRAARQLNCRFLPSACVHIKLWPSPADHDKGSDKLQRDAHAASARHACPPRIRERGGDSRACRHLLHVKVEGSWLPVRRLGVDLRRGLGCRPCTRAPHIKAPAAEGAMCLLGDRGPCGPANHALDLPTDCHRLPGSKAGACGVERPHSSRVAARCSNPSPLLTALINTTACTPGVPSECPPTCKHAALQAVERSSPSRQQVRCWACEAHMHAVRRVAGREAAGAARSEHRCSAAASWRAQGRRGADPLAAALCSKPGAVLLARAHLLNPS